MLKAQFEAVIAAIEDGQDEGYWIKIRTISGDEQNGAHMLMPSGHTFLLALERPASDTTPRTVRFIDLAAVESVQLDE